MTNEELIKWFTLKYPALVEEMRNCSHHFDNENLNPYHLEGDVWSHTISALHAAKGDSLTVRLAVLLHDIGKPQTRKENPEKKRVSFVGHDAISSFKARGILDQFEHDTGILVDTAVILTIIALHTQTFKLTEDQMFEQGFGNIPEIYDLSRYDDMGALSEIPSNNGEAIFHKLFDNRKIDFKVTFMVGLPCSGKSTYIAQNLADKPVLSRDDIVMEVGLENGFKTYSEAFNGVCQDEVNLRFHKRKQELIRTKQDFVVDMTMMNRKARRMILNCLPKEAFTEAIVMFPSLEEIHSRNLKRTLETGKSIPEEVFERFMWGFYPPVMDEFDNIKWEL